MRKLITTALFLLLGLNLHAQNKMFKNPGCMCCDRWVEHMQMNGMSIEIVQSQNMSQIRNELGVPKEARGCHTSIIDGIIVEGHVPADLVHKVLKERPEGMIGIAVPSMPVGSPGMEGGYKEDYAVMVFDSKGKTHVYELR